MALLYFAQEAFIFQPDSLTPNHQYHFNSEFEEFNLTAQDGARLNALHFKAHEPKGVILYFHGNAGNLDRWGEVVEYHVQLGYDAIIMDYRKYGKSTGKWSHNKFLSDAELFYDYTQEHYPEDRITVYGRSLGTGPASWVASRNRPAKLILETPYTSMVEMGRNFYPIAPVGLLIRYNFAPKRYLQKVNCPIYILHGTSDMIVPFKFGQELFEMFNGEKQIELISIENGGHNNLVEFDEFRSSIERILQ
ncbi:MAG: alpha/beta fold hydrolase [Cyclobacteriaceae bacterium]